jgi:hypothetical protein
MKKNIEIIIKKFRFYIGLYDEADMCLFNIHFLYNGKDFFTFFQFQIAKFYIGFCLYK